MPFKKGDTFGDKNARWNGGRTRANGGYILVKAPIGHPHAIKSGYIREHRLVMEGVLGRFLLPTEDVDHINGIKTDNRPENLQLMASRGEHLRTEHSRGLYRNHLDQLNANKKELTHCPKGHPYSGRNLYVYKNHRACRMCRSIASKKQLVKELV